MNPQNRISATLADQALTDILGHLQAVRDALPFLVNIPTDERNAVPKFGDKSQAFDDKIKDYEQQRPDLTPANVVDVAETNKDRALRVQMKTINGVLGQLADDCFCTELALGGDISESDSAYYNYIQFAAAHGIPGAQAIADDLKQRYPSTPRKPATPKAPKP